MSNSFKAFLALAVVLINIIVTYRGQSFDLASFFIGANIIIFLDYATQAAKEQS
jgi:hypothetical protein